MKQVGNWWFPDFDSHCHKVVASTVGDMDKAIPLCKKFDCAVQAGGNVGIWARYLAERFETVWSFEPGFHNFECMRKNVTGVNIIHAGLGNECGTGALDYLPHEKNNCGAWHTVPGAQFAVLTIDSLHLSACDLIILDTEGNEPEILEGAKKTIASHRPVLMVEDKGLSDKYGVPMGWTDAIEGYQVADRVRRDVILVPE